MHIKKFITEHKAAAIKLTVFIAVGTVYCLFILFTGYGIPCPIRAITGLYCPGCGISHIFTDIARLDIVSAVNQNYLLDVLFVAWLPVVILRAVKNPPFLSVNGRFYNTLAFSSLAAALIFGILRNIPAFSFLLPLYAR